MKSAHFILFTLQPRRQKSGCWLEDWGSILSRGKNISLRHHVLNGCRVHRISSYPMSIEAFFPKSKATLA